MVRSEHVIHAMGGNGSKAFRCFACARLITRSDHLISLRGRNRHVFVNPAGVEFDFRTFRSCVGAVAVSEPTVEHTWFAGYAWRFALCGKCGQHLGWHYEDVSSFNRPSAFWGILVSRVHG